MNSTPQTNYLPYGARFSNPAAAAGAFLGKACLYPTKKIIELSFKLIESCENGPENSTFTRKTFFVARFVLHLIAIISLLPFALTALPFGIGLSILTDYARPDFVFINPNEEEQEARKAPEKLKICSFNVALMPEFITQRNGVRPSSERIDEIANGIRKRDDDIVLMQEAFEEEPCLELADKLENYPHKILLVGQESIRLGSGLALFSKYPLSNVIFWKHPEVGGAEEWANKGILGATASIGKGKCVFIFTTHLNGGAPPPGGAYFRGRQIAHVKQRISDYIERFGKENPENIMGVFLGGDFNIGPDMGNEEAENNPEWSNHLNFFRGAFQEDYFGDGPPYPPDSGIDNNSHFGTAFHLSSGDKITGWKTDQLGDWKIQRECLDHLLRMEPPQEIEPSDPITNVPLFEGSHYRDGEYIRDLMDGSSDHLAIRASFSLKD